MVDVVSFVQLCSKRSWSVLCLLLACCLGHFLVAYSFGFTAPPAQLHHYISTACIRETKSDSHQM